jgi:hypothetical protein
LTYTETHAILNQHAKEPADINEVLRWLGEENQARADEIMDLQQTPTSADEWKQRRLIEFKNLDNEEAV